MICIGNSSRFIKLENLEAFVLEKGKPVDIDISRQANREVFFQFAQALYLYPAEYPAEMEVRVEKEHVFRIPELGTFRVSAGEVRKLPRLAAVYLIFRFAATPTDRKLFAPTRPLPLTEEQIVKLHDEAQAAEAERSGSWVMRWQRNQRK